MNESPRLGTLLVITGLCLLIMFSSVGIASAQNLFSKAISINVKEKKLAEVLNEISNKGNFYFSYNGRLLPKDSLISIAVTEVPVREILGRILGNSYELEERNNYIIITAALPRLSVINPDLTAEDNSFSVSGIIVDAHTGERLSNASIYEKNLLIATLTDDHGYFRLKFKADAGGQISLTASKLSYKDTTINFLRPLKVNSRVRYARYKNSYGKGSRVERTGAGRLLISARQRIQSMNIPDFFATRPFQISLTPGLSSRSIFSPQVINKFSLNLSGGYTAGTNGIEFGGLFNINKQDSRYLQIAGIFNLVGGNSVGLQLAGAHNRTLDTLKGVQLSMFANKAEKQVSGVQISALHNETHKLKGLQIGLFNVADSSAGASIGLVNIVRNGFYKVAYSANNLSNTNLMLKTGTHRFYSALITSANISGQNKFYAFGLGIGHDFMFSDKFYLSAEGDYLFAYTGSLNDRWLQGKLLLNIQLSKNISLIAGPTYNKYSYTGGLKGYQSKFLLPENYVRGNSNPVKRWTGWEAGIAFNSVFKPAKRVVDSSAAWYINIGATAGTAWDKPYGLTTGAEFSVQRDLGENLVGTISTGYTHIQAKSDYLFARLGGTYFYAKPLYIIPVKAGIRLKFGNTFFIAGDIGEAFGPKTARVVSNADANQAIYYPNPSYHSLMYGVSAGFSFRNGLEPGVKFEDYGLQSQYKQLALRLGYRIRLSR